MIVRCPDCQNTVSSEAKACQSCGCPIFATSARYIQRMSSWRSQIILCFLWCFPFSFLVAALVNFAFAAAVDQSGGVMIAAIALGFTWIVAFVRFAVLLFSKPS